LVRGKKIEYAGLDGAFLAHCRLRRLQIVLWNQWHETKVYLKPPGLACAKCRFTQEYQYVGVYGRKLS
ncbi:hypothetical protein, partial [Mesorhizobium sp. M0276]|uniref:hypothetical protein n=1 Tax=Mesorhizobium sp. M0276 TaxID=2956928 RepID=UPI00333956CE